MTTDEALFELASFSSDPLGFVLNMFPWGKDGTELARLSGPAPWQLRVLNHIHDRLAEGAGLDEAIRIARVSGHGIGKSTLVAWISWWALSTLEDTRGVITANTEKQLTTKTRAEIAKWHKLFKHGDLFKMTATAMFSADVKSEMTWRIDLIPWSENNAEAFAGLHNRGKRILIIFDEASTIANIIWETTEGALTDPDTQIIWCVFGNPTINTGRFRECFSKYKHRWDTEQIDARDVPFNVNAKQHAQWLEDYDVDDDFIRVRVRGVFPRAGTMQFIPSDVADGAQEREAVCHRHDPLVLGVDVARYGDDASVIYIRKGRDGRTYPPVKLRGVDTMTLAGRVAQLHLEYRADAVFVDGTGVGGGVVDRLRQLRVPVWDIQFGAKSDQVYDGLSDGVQFANKRAEMWGSMREWLKGGSIPKDPEFRDELVGIQYGFNVQQQILLEKKEDMKKRGLPSPDIADALALTFAYPVIPRGWAGTAGFDEPPPLPESDYDPFNPPVKAGDNPNVIHDYNPMDNI